MGKRCKKTKSNTTEIDLDKINIDRLAVLDENTLRKQVIIPLLKYIDVQNVTDMHGVDEEGIDIYFETLDIFGIRLRWGIQVKNEDLVYAAESSNRNLVTILNQIQMAFSKRIRVMTPERSGPSYIDGFYIVTSGKLTGGAMDHIQDNRNKYHNIHIIDGNMLLDIIRNRDSLKRREIRSLTGSPKAISDSISLTGEKNE